ncbi:hypothetical protein [Paludisphaera borealis]|uniref:Uncharacterized protein n=1 Tax=Paludisphaera borealis TaxID=1387353 RepID=A0A1U7CWQ6_9BACT|nr:hypothetical protein [Paludisphaera borealis]APW63313.1 hypothetical protein BSF38_04877 [Paludisphaera borealis]
MPTDRPMGRGPMRLWLKSTLGSGVLETLRPSEATGGGDPDSFARDLLAKLREADGGFRPDDPLALAFREFRRWVEAERRSRRLGLLGPPRARQRLPETIRPRDDRAAGKVATVGKASAEKPLTVVSRLLTRVRSAFASRARVRPADLANPLWDRWLDG